MKPLMSLDGESLIASMLHLLLPLTLVSLIALMMVRGVFRNHPAVRYFICFTALLVLLLSPGAVWLQSKAGPGLLTLSLPVKFIPFPSTTGAASPTLSRNAEAKDEGGGASIVQLAKERAGWGVLTLWAIGMMYGMVRLAHGWYEVSRLTVTARPWDSSSYCATLEQVERVLGRTLSPILTAPGIDSPVVIGIVHPRVILPDMLTESATPLQLRHVLLHEGAHVAFRHTFGGVMERVARLLFWPHPLVHLLCRELGRAREEVCDNVASQEDGAACYARTLLAMAQGLVAAPNMPSALALLGPGTSLEDRIAGLLNPRRNRMVRVQQWKVWAGTALAVFALASIVGVRVVASEAKEKRDAVIVPDDAGKLAAKREAEARTAPRAAQPVEVHKVGPNEFVFWIGGKKVGPLHVQPQPDSLDLKKITGEAAVIAAKEKLEMNASRSADETEEIAAKKKALAEASGVASGGQRAKQPAPGASAAELLAAKREAEAKAKKN